jgi:hypothetical protein
MRSVRFAFLVLFVALASGQDRSQPKSPDSQAPKTNQNSGNNPPSEIQSGTHGADKANSTKASSEQEPRPWLTHGEWVMAVLTLIYVLITGFYAWTSHKTLNALEEQGRQALQSSQTAINAERAWILVTTDIDGVNPREATIYVRGKNWGRTPAEISRCSVMYLPYSDEKDLPEEPPYQQTELKYPKHVAPNEAFAISDSPFFLGMELTDELWDDFNKKGQRLFFIGHVVYKDLISRGDHETRFCFLLSRTPGIGLIMTGPRHYNRHT